MMSVTPKSKKKRVAGRIILLLAVICVAALVIYCRPVKAGDNAADYMVSTDTVAFSEQDGVMFFDGPGEDACMIFYPGARIDYHAYAPLMQKIAEAGVDCYCIRMPLNFAIMDVSAASDIIEEGEYSEYYLAGHSLGSVACTNYAYKNPDLVAGVILLAGESTRDLNIEGMRALSVYGSLDGVLNLEKYNGYKENLPDGFMELVINGGNHTQFGAYSLQRGDNEAAISPEEQWDQTAAAITRFVIER